MQVPSPKTLLYAALALALVACMHTHRGKGQPPPPIDPPQVAPTASRTPAPRTTTPMPGEPSGADLQGARLLPSSCGDHDATVRTRIARMRAEVDAEFRWWHEQQPACWAQDRQREKDRKELEACVRRGECLVGQGVGYGFGAMASLHSAGSGHARLAGGLPRAAKSMSRTNNQVANVDEADLVKTDGRFVYIAAQGALRILEAMNPRVVSVTKLPDVVRELFVEGDRAVVFTSSHEGVDRCTYGYDCTVAGDGSSTRIHVIDISDRSRPKPVRQIDLSGSLIASRRIGTTVHTVVTDGDDANGDYEAWPSELETCGLMEPVVRKRLARLKVENERKIRKTAVLPTMHDRGSPTPLCAGLYESQFDQAHTFTTVVSFDMADERVPAATATVRSRPGAVFASEGALYFSTTRRRTSPHSWYSFYADVGEASELHKFHIGARPNETRYVGSGLVPGHVLNQFAMDEWHDYLRIATTRGKVPSPNVESAVSILTEGEGGNLVRVGAVEHIAPGEDIRAVRFDDERAYIVTFKKTDPLFVLDLSDVAQPTILGALKIPGFSTYLHRIDPDHLLSIGFDADDQGTFAYFGGVLLQLFDVRHPTDPKLLHKEKLGTRGSSSAATSDHLAFNYFAEKGLLAIPMTLCEGGAEGRNGDRMTFSGLLVYRVGVPSGFERVGAIDHGRGNARCNAWWSHGNSAVVRSVFLDDLVYSVALDRVKVQRMGAFGTDVANIAFAP